MKYHIIKINEKFGCKDDDDSWILMPEYEKLEISNNCVICKKNATGTGHWHHNPWGSYNPYSLQYYSFGKEKWFWILDVVGSEVLRWLVLTEAGVNQKDLG